MRIREGMTFPYATMNFTWSGDKNDLLKRHRSVAFEDVVIAIVQGRIVDVIYDRNPECYPGQHLLLVMVRGYLYTVPFYQIDNDTMRFITVYPDSRRMARYGLARE